MREVTARSAVAPPPDGADAPPARRNLIFAIVSIGLFMASVDQTIVATALPAIEKELHTQINWASWTITIYALGQVVAMPMAGKISDMFGRKRVFLIAVVVFTVSSLCCGFAGHIYLLLIPQAFQALGGGAFMPSATGIGLMNLVNLVYGAAVLGFAALVPLYAQERYHIAALGAGTLLTARAAGMISVASLAVFTMRRTGYRLPMIGGFMILTAGLLLMAWPAPISPYAWLAIGAAVTGCGMGLSVPSTNNATLPLAPDQVAAIAGLRGMFRQSGSIIAVSITAAIIARSHDPGLMQARVFVVFALLMVALLPVVWFGVPDHRGNW